MTTDLDDIGVGDAMHKRIRSCRPDAPLIELAEGHGNQSRAPVVIADGDSWRPAGVVSDPAVVVACDPPGADRPPR